MAAQSWTEEQLARLAACHDCDGLYELPELAEHEVAKCPRCRGRLTKNVPRGVNRAAASALGAAALMIVANFFPFMTIKVAGQSNTVTLFGAVEMLWGVDDPVLSIAVFVFMLGLPTMIILSQLYILFPLLVGRVLPGTRRLLKLRQAWVPWSMVEVFFLGVLVSLLKLVKLADVGFGAAFWALAAMILCFTASVVSVDRRVLWARVSERRQV